MYLPADGGGRAPGEQLVYLLSPPPLHAPAVQLL